MLRDKKRILSEYLVVSAQTGDRRAFALLAKNWQPALLRHALRLSGDQDMARDILQDAWVDIVRGLPSLNDAAAFPAWAYRIVSRKCATAIRKIQRVRRTKEAIASEPVSVPDGECSVERNADLAPITRAISNLSPEQKSVIALFYNEDLGVAEISIALSIPVGTIKTRLMHARRKIRLALEGPNEGGSNEQ